ncbi:MAG: TIGR02996 domain-containing protein [Kofleriaceae bacterium]
MSVRTSLEAAIIADPDAREAHAVYADHLLEHGDPAGEFIAVQLALEAAPDDGPLLARERALIAERTEALRRLFYVAMRAIRDPVWRRGLLHSIAVHGDAYSHETADACAELLADPEARFLRDLVVRSVTVMHGTPTPDDGNLVAALAKAIPASLRRLFFDPLDFQLSWTRLTSLEPLYPRLAQLEELSIVAGDLVLGRVELPALRSLALVTGGLGAHVLRSIAEATWPRLERLEVHLGTDRYGGDCTLADVAPILEGAMLPHVTTLALCNCEFGDELAEAVAASKILPQLRVLELSGSTTSDAGARAILDRGASFAHLAKLDLSDCYLTSATLTELAAFGANVLGQRVPDDNGDRYCTLDE